MGMRMMMKWLWEEVVVVMVGEMEVMIEGGAEEDVMVTVINQVSHLIHTTIHVPYCN